MKKMKKIISWFLASALTFGCVSLPANAAEIYCLPAETADTPDSAEPNEQSDTDTSDTPDTAEIPQTHDKDITPIIEEGQCGTEVYYELHESGTVYIFGNGDLKEIELPKSLTDIYSCAFNDCSSLTDIYYKSRKDMWDCIYIDEWGNDDLLNADIHYNSRMGETYDEPDTDEYRINFEFVDDRLDIEVYNADKDTFEAVQGDSIILEGKDLFIHVPLQSINSGKLIMKQPDINIYGKFDYFGTNFMENGQDYYFSISGIRSNIVVEFYFDEDIIPYGDVNGDGKVTAKDAMTAQRYAIKLAELSDEQIIIADVDKNGTVTALDALYILRYSLNLVDLPIKPS